MRIFLLTALTMIAFAANSIINRMALIEPLIDPTSFALIRLIAGSAVLWFILGLRGQASRESLRANPWSVLGLAAYALGFSYAYVTLDAGLGALLLFGGVQMTMFLGATILGNRPKTLQWAGAGIGFSGLAYLLNPTTTALDLLGAGLMLIAAVGWGIYTLIGQRQTNAPLAAAQSFLFASPIALLIWMFVSGDWNFSAAGVGLAVMSGSVFSGLGYLLWFSILPKLATTTAAVAQLTVPLIAMVGGMLFLSEPWTVQFGIAAALVLGGIALSIWAGRMTQSSRKT